MEGVAIPHTWSHDDSVTQLLPCFCHAAAAAATEPGFFPRYNVVIYESQQADHCNPISPPSLSVFSFQQSVLVLLSAFLSPPQLRIPRDEGTLCLVDCWPHKRHCANDYLLFSSFYLSAISPVSATMGFIIETALSSEIVSTLVWSLKINQRMNS